MLFARFSIKKLPLLLLFYEGSLFGSLKHGSLDWKIVRGTKRKKNTTLLKVRSRGEMKECMCMFIVKSHKGCEF